MRTDPPTAFLPLIAANGQKVYAGFFKRACAGLVDALITVPLYFGSLRMQEWGRASAVVAAIVIAFFVATYNVGFNARFGGTPGKLAVGIRVTRPNGSPIGWVEAWKRSFVDVVFGLIYMAVFIWVLLQIDFAAYVSLEGRENTQLLRSHWLSWHGAVEDLSFIWTCSELAVLLCNERRRALHDFIAGTVVIDKAFAQSPARPTS